MVLPLKSGAGPYIAVHAKLTAMDSSLLIFTLLVRSPEFFFPKPLPSFS